MTDPASAPLTAADLPFFGRSGLDVAPDLLGRHLAHSTAAGRVVVRLTEVEAYLGGDDPGSHAFRGQTPRTAVMFGPPGHLYVYFTYGMHWCVNIVCGRSGVPSAVLLRGGEVVEGLDLARARRPTSKSDRDLARGPSRLAKALGLDAAANGAALGGDVELSGGRAAGTVVTGPRVGVSGPGGDAEQYPWRFWLDGEPTVSVYRPGVVRGKPRRTAGAPSGTLDPDTGRTARPVSTRGLP